MKLTPLLIVNFLFFQWFFIRLTKVYDTETKEVVKWMFLKYPLPLTGWWSDYVFLA